MSETRTRILRLLAHPKGRRWTTGQVHDALMAQEFFKPHSREETIQVLTRLEELDKISTEFPTASEFTHWIEPPKEKCHVCGERGCVIHDYETR